MRIRDERGSRAGDVHAAGVAEPLSQLFPEKRVAVYRVALAEDAPTSLGR